MFNKKNILYVVALLTFGMGTYVVARERQASKRQAQEESAVKEATPDTFQSLVLDNQTPSVVLFYAPWCGHCKSFKPRFIQMAEENGMYNFVKIDADKYSDFVAPYGIEGYPTVILFQDGQQIDQPNASEDSIRKSMQQNFKQQDKADNAAAGA